MIETIARPEVSTEPLSLEKAERLRVSAARKAAGIFHGYVEFEDMMQVAYMATLEHPRKAREYEEAGDDKRWFRLVYKACTLYGQKQKASALGYRYEDLFFYSLKALRRILPLVLDNEHVQDTDALMDVSRALSELSMADHQLLWWAFKGDPDEEAGYQNVAAHLAVSVGAARGRVDRVLRRLQEGLGGENPAPRRRPRSNAAAMAETRTAWDGEA